MVVTPRYDCRQCPRRGLLLQDMQPTGRVRLRDGKPHASWCKECNRVKAKAGYGRHRSQRRAKSKADYEFRMRVDPAGVRRKERAAKRRRQQREPERQAHLDAERQRRYRAKRRKDPVRHALKKAADRAAYRQRQAAKGLAVKGRVKPRTTIDKQKVPAQPVWRVVARYMAASGATKEDVAAGTGVSVSLLARWEQGQRTTDYDTADRLLVYLSLLPHDVWGTEGGQAP